MDELKKRSIDEEVGGRAERMKGKIKEGAGRALDREDLIDEGEADQASGKVREKIGRMGRNVSDAVERAREKVRGED